MNVFSKGKGIVVEFEEKHEVRNCISPQIPIVVESSIVM